MNNYIQNHIKIALHVLILSKHSQRKNNHHEIPDKPWEVVGVDMFTQHSKYCLCIGVYHSKFLVIKQLEDLITDNLIQACKFIFSEYGLPKKIMSDPGSKFIREKFKGFCHSMNIEQAVSSSYHHQSNGQVETCIKFKNHTIKKFINTKSDIHVALLQIRLTPLGPGLQSLATLIQSSNKRYHTNN